ncbi:MAG: hypothetical protein AMXMBFR84_21740 [Candidatus Hydrogenedentota bacterium]
MYISISAKDIENVEECGEKLIHIQSEDGRDQSQNNQQNFHRITPCKLETTPPYPDGSYSILIHWPQLNWKPRID